MSTTKVALTLDARGLSCPMPIVRARKAIETLAVGDVMEVLVTDKGAPTDFRAWCQQTEHKFVEARQEDGFIRLVLKKLVPETKEKGRQFPHDMSNQELQRKLEAGQGITVIDVREADEFAVGHIPGAVSVPIESVDNQTSLLANLNPAALTAVVCRSARRSDYACQILSRKGFTNLFNVVPGMSGWTGPMEK